MWLFFSFICCYGKSRLDLCLTTDKKKSCVLQNYFYKIIIYSLSLLLSLLNSKGFVVSPMQTSSFLGSDLLHLKIYFTKIP